MTPATQRAAEHLGAGRSAEALQACSEALAANPNNADALHISALVLFREGDAETAIDRLSRAIELAPQSAEMLANLGQIQLERGEYEAAEACFAASLDLTDDPFTRLRYALSLHRQGKLADAEAAYRDLIRRAPDYAPAYNDLAVNLRLQNKPQEAIAAFDTAARIDPGNLAAAAMALRMRLSLGIWDGLDQVRARIVEPALRPGPVQPPSPLNVLALPIHVEPGEFRALVTRYAATMGLGAAPRFTYPMPHPRPRLKIGYISSDFGNHPVGHIVSRLFQHHDRSAFEVFAYATAPDAGSAERRQIASGVEHLVELAGMDSGAAARRIHQDQIDILVDLNGHTEGNRLDILALRPSPVQATWLGFPGTTGTDFIDYLMADRIIVPDAERRHYAEQIVHLPAASFALPPMAGERPNRRAYGLPEEAVVFAVFSGTYKIEPTVFAIWMGLLAQVPGSVLWLWINDDGVLPTLRAHAQKAGIDPMRLIAAPTIARSEYLIRQRAADLLLDTLFYGAHSTAAHALAAGVPFVTATGRLNAARVGTALLHAAGLPELAGASPEEYERIALRLARDPAALGDIRRRLAEAHRTAPLFDPARFMRGMESAFRGMWENYAAGRRPQPIAVDPV